MVAVLSQPMFFATSGKPLGCRRLTLCEGMAALTPKRTLDQIRYRSQSLQTAVQTLQS
jgi:hypothetical protein